MGDRARFGGFSFRQLRRDARSGRGGVAGGGDAAVDRRQQFPRGCNSRGRNAGPRFGGLRLDESGFDRLLQIGAREAGADEGGRRVTFRRALARAPVAAEREFLG